MRPLSASPWATRSELRLRLSRTQSNAELVPLSLVSSNSCNREARPTLHSDRRHPCGLPQRGVARWRDASRALNGRPAGPSLEGMDVGEVIRRNYAEIVRSWNEEAARASAARGLSGPAGRDVIPAYLATLAKGAEAEQEEMREIEEHLAARIRQGFDLGEILDEFQILGRCVAPYYGKLPLDQQPRPSDIERWHESLGRASRTAIRLFQEHLQFDEQHEKLYLRVLQSIADTALRDSQLLTERLNEIADLVMQATGAQTAAIFLRDAETRRLVMSASAGAAGDGRGQYFAAADLESFLDSVVASDVPTQVSNAAPTDVEVGNGLREVDILSILGVRLRPHNELLGVMCIGISEHRPFSASEVRRIEAMGDKLALHLENAGLYARLRERIAELDKERVLREGFVSVLAHDLRGPLTTAKISAGTLASSPDVVGPRRQTAVRIEKALDQLDRMIRDLLDANRVRAGQKLPVHLAECDLGEIARQVIDDMQAVQHEPRVRLQAEGEHRGWWSADELRRALWNMVTNGLKHGASDRPILVRVQRTETGERLSVHNSGHPIPAEAQARLFEPFARLPDATGRAGWGLGLTLVRACAEAHGGTVTMESTTEAGTTFAIELPRDSRPYQTR